MKYLGIQSASSGNQDAQYQSSISTAKLGARTLDTNPFGRYHAKVYLNTHLNQKLYYPFTCSSLTHKQYIAINKAHIPSALSSMGCNRTWPLPLRYGCHSYGGLQLKHPQVESLIKRINAIQSILSKPDTASVFSHSSIVVSTRCRYINPNPWKSSFSLKYVNSVWTKDLLRLLRKYNVQLKIKLLYNYPPPPLSPNELMILIL